MDLPVIPPTRDDSVFKLIPHLVEIFTRYEMPLHKQLYSTIRYEKGSLVFYMNQEKEYRDKAVKMIDYLSKEYHLENN